MDLLLCLLTQGGILVLASTLCWVIEFGVDLVALWKYAGFFKDSNQDLE